MVFGIWLYQRDTGFQINKFALDDTKKLKIMEMLGIILKKPAMITWHKSFQKYLNLFPTY